MKIKRCLGFAVCLSLTMAIYCYADLQAGSQTLTFFGGGSASSTQLQIDGPNGGKDRLADVGNAFGGQYMYYLKSSPSIAVGLDGQHSTLGDHVSNDILKNNSSLTRLHSSVIMAVGRLGFPTGRLRPYVFGGLGFHRSSLTWGSQPQSGQFWPDTHTTEIRVLVDNNSGGFAAGLGVGADLYLAEPLFLGAEFRGTALTGSSFSPTPSGQSIGLQPVTGTFWLTNFFLRIGYKFGN